MWFGSAGVGCPRAVSTDSKPPYTQAVVSRVHPRDPQLLERIQGMENFAGRATYCFLCLLLDVPTNFVTKRGG